MNASQIFKRPRVKKQKRKINHILLASGLIIAAIGNDGISIGPCQKSPKPEKGVLIEKMLRRAVVDKKDIPDYGLINDKSKILLSNLGISFWEKGPVSDTMQSGSVPQFKNVKIILFSPAEIQKLADEQGNFLYLQFGKIEIMGNVARVEIATCWAVSRENQSRMIMMSAGGYERQFSKRNGEWIFEKELKRFVS